MVDLAVCFDSESTVSILSTFGSDLSHDSSVVERASKQEELSIFIAMRLVFFFIPALWIINLQRAHPLNLSFQK